VSTKDGSAETGIVVAGAGDCFCKGKVERHAFVLEDVTGSRIEQYEPVHLTPLEWGQKASQAYHRWNATRMVAEVNQGGDMVISNIQTVDKTIYPVPIHAHDGKRARAEPVATLYERGMVHHVGVFNELESQMTTWAALKSGERSPDRIDALVMTLTDLLLDPEDLTLAKDFAIPWSKQARGYR
jgi:phage terminase large subunit-like protein